MTPGLVTVVIPTVHRLPLLRESIQSVLSQTYRHFELIVSNNSGDGEYGKRTGELVATFGDPRIRCLHQARQLSMVAHCNALVAQGDGEFWLYLPDDDLLEARCLELLRGALDGHPQAGFSFSDHWIVSFEGVRLESTTDDNSRGYRRSEIKEGPVNHDQLLELALRQSFELQSMLFRTSVIRSLKFDEDFDALPDYELQIRTAMSRVTGDAVYVADRLTAYRHHDGQYSASEAFRRTNLQLVQLMNRVGPCTGDSESARRERLARGHRTLAILAAESGSRGEALMHFKKSLEHGAGTELRSTLAALPLALAPRKAIQFARYFRRSLRRWRSRG